MDLEAALALSLGFGAHWDSGVMTLDFHFNAASKLIILTMLRRDLKCIDCRVVTSHPILQ